jgi:cobalt-zinc-cadmium efflux system outer membrane protein
LTLEEALDLARARAARVIAAAGRVEEARARLAPASRRLRENPVLELSGGHRKAEESFTDYGVSASQGFEPSALRRARIAGAEAAVDMARAELEDTRRLYLGEVAAAFARALAAEERLRISSEARRLADDLLATIERRFRMGEATALAINRARTAAARARAGQGAAEGERLGTVGGLRALLGMEADEALSPAGALGEIPSYDLDALLARAAERADLQALAAGVREAEAQVRLGEALARPDFGLRTGYEHDEGAEVVSAGIAIALPWSRSGQEERAVGQVRASHLQAQREATRRAAMVEVRAAFEAWQRHVQAVRELEGTALPAVADNEALAQRSFEVGEINLGELLLIRQEILETRLSYLDLLLEARLAAVDLETKAGALR